MLQYILYFTLTVGMCHANTNCVSCQQSQMAFLNERMNQMINALYSSPCFSNLYQSTPPDTPPAAPPCESKDVSTNSYDNYFSLLPYPCLPSPQPNPSQIVYVNPSTPPPACTCPSNPSPQNPMQISPQYSYPQLEYSPQVCNQQAASYGTASPYPTTSEYQYSSPIPNQIPSQCVQPPMPQPQPYPQQNPSQCVQPQPMPQPQPQPYPQQNPCQCIQPQPIPQPQPCPHQNHMVVPYPQQPAQISYEQYLQSYSPQNPQANVVQQQAVPQIPYYQSPSCPNKVQDQPSYAQSPNSAYPTYSYPPTSTYSGMVNTPTTAMSPGSYYS